MAAQIINGFELAKEKRAQLAKEVEQLKQQGIEPALAVILVGDHPASQSYVKAKQKACEEIGIRSILLTFPNDISEAFLLEQIARLNEDQSVHGILVQLPLPKQMNELHIIEAIAPEKMSMGSIR